MLLANMVSAQSDRRGDSWVIGTNRTISQELMEIKFLGDSMTLQTFSSNHSMESPSITSYSDKDGNLLLYSNGCGIYNKHHEVLENGGDIFEKYDLINLCNRGYTGNPDGVSFLPDPCDDNLVYLIYLDLVLESFDLFSEKLVYTSVDVSNPNKPFINQKGEVINKDRYEMGSLFTTQHDNGIDWWVCILRLDTNCYDCFHLSATGFSEPIRSCSGTIWDSVDGDTGVGPGGFSPDGSTYVRFNFDFGLNVYDFDKSTGLLSHREQIFCLLYTSPSPRDS